MAWTEDRKNELGELHLLLQTASTLNQSTGAIDKIQRIIELSKKLTAGDLDTGRLSFTQFLAGEAAERSVNACAQP